LKKELSRKYRNLQRLRIFSQFAFLFLFFYLLLRTRFPEGDTIGHVEIFFHFDPLLALTTFVASRVFFPAFILAGVTLFLTLLLGRVFCGWFCPLGTLHQFFSWFFKRTKLLKPRVPKDHHTVWKYYLLIPILIGTFFSLNLAGLLDPFSLLYRSFAVGIMPAVDHTTSSLIGLLYSANLSSVGDGLVQYFEILSLNGVFLQGFFIGALFLGLLLLNMTRERFWCRYLCPLGAFLGLFARWNLLKLRIDEDKCIQCNLCTRQCQTQADPFPNTEWKRSECDYCFTCGAVCPTAAIGFGPRPAPEDRKLVDLDRRRLIITSFVGFLAAPFFRLSPARARASERLIRPPGALPEEQFLKKCVKCGECMKVCPTNALQPTLAEAGPEGIWTPMIVPRIGYCEYYCSLCTQVCPTGAIRELDIEAKNKIKMGSAWIDRNRCIPWKFGNPCIVCEEHCPVSPKAIQLTKIEVKLKDGTIKTPLAPIIDLETCTGCGICENKCPVVDRPAIYVTSVGESRSERNQLLLDMIQPGEGDIYGNKP
jgi:MauM/NapG family ferredoxin protein